MKKTTWLIAIPLGLAGLVAWGAWSVLEARHGESAYGLLEQARALIAENPDSAPLAERMLDRGLAFNPPPALTEALLTERAALRTRAGALSLALEDRLRLKELHPDDEAIKLSIASLKAQLGQREEALAIYDELLEAKPHNGWVRSLKTAELERSASELEAATLAELAELVSPKQLSWASDVIRQVVRLPAEDPVRLGLQSELETRLDEDAELLLGPAMASLSERFESIRSEYAASLKTSVNRSNLAGTTDLYYQAQRLEDCVDFGLAAVSFAASRDHPKTIQDLALALSALGRPKAAAEVINRTTADKPTWHVEFLDGWCAILAEAENWPQLENVAGQLMRSSRWVNSNPNRQSDGAFYIGLAAYNQGRYSAAVGAMRQFVSSGTEGPLEGALGRAWTIIAKSQTELGDTQAARSAWRSCTKAAPNYSAEAWLEAAKTYAQEAASGLAESGALAHAIALDPASASQHLAAFTAAGKRGLEARGIDIKTLAAQLKSAGRWYPKGEPKVYTLYALGQHQLESGEAAGASIIFKRLLTRLPHFVPALDGLAVSQLVLDEPLAQAETMLERLALTGPDAVILAGLKDLADKLEGKDLPAPLLRRWMRLDPGFTGAIELARALEQVGRSTDALVTLTAAPRALFNDRDRVLFAEILAELGYDRGVLDATQEVSPKGPYMLRAALLRTAAAVGLSDFDELGRAIETLEGLHPRLEPESPETELVEATFNRLLKARLGPALLRYSRVFANSDGARDGRRMNQAALAEALFGEPEAAAEWVDAADALSLDGSSLVGRLVQAEAVDDVPTERAAVRDLRDESPAWLGPFELALMAGLEGRTGEARAGLKSLIQETPGDSRLWLATAALDAMTMADGAGLANATPILGAAAVKPLKRIASLNAQGGRRLLTLLLASRAPVWDAWAQDLLHAPIQVALLGPFAVELDARALLAAGQLEEAQTKLASGADRWKAFLPFWDLNEDLALAQHGRPDHPAVVALRRKRRLAGAPPRGGKPPTTAELALDASFEASAQGNLAEALVQARAAAKAAPTAAAVRLNLARVARTLAPKVSQQAYLDYLLDPGTSLTDAEVHGLLAELLDLAPELSEGSLESLAERYPEAPEPVLELARLDRASLGLEAAFERLEDFTQTHSALESLSLGSSQAWFDFMFEYAPARALAFAEGQLDRDPRWLAPWLQEAKGLEATGHLDEALAAWRTLAEMSPSPEVALGHAAIVAQVGGSHKEVTAALQLARQGSAPGKHAGLIEFISARSLANIGSTFLDEAIAKLEQLLGQAETPGIGRSVIERRLGTALLHRGGPGDGPRAVALLAAAAKEVSDPMERDLLDSLGGLGRNLEAELKKRAESEASEEPPAKPTAPTTE